MFGAPLSTSCPPLPARFCLSGPRAPLGLGAPWSTKAPSPAWGLKAPQPPFQPRCHPRGKDRRGEAGCGSWSRQVSGACQEKPPLVVCLQCQQAQGRCQEGQDRMEAMSPWPQAFPGGCKRKQPPWASGPPPRPPPWGWLGAPETHILEGQEDGQDESTEEEGHEQHEEHTLAGREVELQGQDGCQLPGPSGPHRAARHSWGTLAGQGAGQKAKASAAGHLPVLTPRTQRSSPSHTRWPPRPSASLYPSPRSLEPPPPLPSLARRPQS